ncbi:alkaline phosphatase D family protein [Haloarchaeobius litoreus]|uniref:Alkaline phosphatase D family protein n=1 Tax=Haloarchaeobius litoreus TaxID=755306 RepID=A0ABD6DQ30_9EURY|nr:alkaline phosphatase D family protein [Haloarchaeobius litoreus]
MQPDAYLEDGCPPGEFSEDLEPVPLDHGTVVGDVTAKTAVVWTRTDGPALVHLTYWRADSTGDRERVTPLPSVEADDCTVRFRLADLQPDTGYEYQLWAAAGFGAGAISEPLGEPTTGRFRTAPAPDESGPVSLVWTGDTWGQGRAPPYQVPAQMADRDPDCFLYLGDTIYADHGTPALPDGEPETVDDYRAKYREVRAEAPNLRELLASTATVAIWDDHEVGNDWAGTEEPRLPAARQAFLEYWPVDQHPSVTGEDEGRLYRSFQWGSELALFVLDSRQYRDDNTETDGPEKTMLGDEQREWLKEGLAETDATFTLVASSVSLSSPSSAAGARDSWADGDADTGFEHELDELLSHICQEVDSTVVWLTGDRHFARVASFDIDGDGRPELYEALASPMGAAPRDPGVPDTTFGPNIHYEEGGKYEYGEFYNFGEVRVEDGSLSISIFDKVGDRRCRVTIDADGDGWPTVEDTRTLSGPSLMGTLRRSFDDFSRLWR